MIWLNDLISSYNFNKNNEDNCPYFNDYNDNNYSNPRCVCERRVRKRHLPDARGGCGSVRVLGVGR